MDTSLKLFSEAFDVTPEEMYILMLSDKEFFKEPLKIKMNYGEIRLNRELMDKLENLYYEKKDSVGDNNNETRENRNKTTKGKLQVF